MIFLDNNATTKTLPEVIEALLYDYDGIPRNPSSITNFGREGKQKLIQARDQISAFLGVTPNEIVFTSGGTESNHMLINGFYQKKPGTIITTNIEHSSALEPIRHLKTKVIYLDVEERGSPTPTQVANAITPSTSFIFLSGSNSETGALLDLEPIANLAFDHGVPLIIDGVQLLGKENFTPLPKGVSGLSLSSHKCHGPKGVGLAVIRKPYKIPPLFRGGHQEHDMRAGTENLGAILGFAKAISLIRKETPDEIRLLRDYFETAVVEKFPGIEINAIKGPRISNTSNIYFNGIDAETLLIKLDQEKVIASLGSACSSGSLEPSHVLLGMGYSRERALSSLRFSLSRLTTRDELNKTLAILSRLFSKGCDSNCFIS